MQHGETRQHACCPTWKLKRRTISAGQIWPASAPADHASRCPGQHPGAQRFDHIGAAFFEHLAHRAGAQDEPVIGAATHLFGADLDPDVATVLDHPMDRAGHDMKQTVIGPRQHVLPFFLEIGADPAAAARV